MPAIPIFLSSTFRDFHAERDVLVTDVRAQLDEVLAPTGCRVDIVDLRWGINTVGGDEEAQHRQVLDVCLGEVARSRPLFVGLVGERYGWRPPPERLRSTAQQAGLTRTDIGGWSVTELEFEYGAFGADAATALFFVRDLVGPSPTGWVDDDPHPIGALRNRVASSGRPTYRYAAHVWNDRLHPQSAADFQQLAVSVLTPLVVARAQALIGKDPDPYEAAAELFIDDRTSVVVGRDDLVTELVDAITRPGVRTVLHGPSGTGKSTVWCAAVEMLRRQATTVVAIGVGITSGTTSERDLLERIVGSFGEQIPAGRTVAEATAWTMGVLGSNGPVVLAIDALDGLDPGPSRSSLPFLIGLPPTTSVLCTTTDDAQVDVLARAGFDVCAVPPLTQHELIAIADSTARRFHRQLPGSVLRWFGREGASPLWARLALGELLALDEGDLGQLDPGADAIEALLERTAAALPPDVASLATGMFSRCEQRFGPQPTAAVLAALVVSRSGLGPGDLARMTGLPALTIAGIRRRLDSIIVARGSDGRLGFAHGQLHQAASHRYVPDPLLVHRWLANFLTAITDSDAVAEADRYFHTLLAHGAPAGSDLLNAHLPSSGYPPTVLRAFTEALRAATGITSADGEAVTYLLGPVERSTWGAIWFLASWLDSPDASTVSAVQRIAVAAYATAAGRALERVPRPSDRQAMMPGSAGTFDTWFDWLLSPPGFETSRLVARTLRQQGEATIDAQGATRESEKLLTEASHRLSELLGAIDVLETLQARGELRGEVQVAVLTQRDPILGERVRAQEAVARLRVERGSSSTSAAAKSVDRLSDLSSRLVGEQPDAPDSLLAHLASLDLQAGLALKDGDLERAATLADEQLSSASGTIGPDASPAAVGAHLAALRRVALVAVRRQAGNARSSTEAFVVRSRQVSDGDPSSIPALLTLAEALELRCRALSGDPAAVATAETTATELLAITDHLLRHDPGSVAAADLRMRALTHLADLAGDENRWPDARDGYAEAYKIGHRLQKQDASRALGELRELKAKAKVAKARAKGGVLGRLIDTSEDAKRSVVLEEQYEAFDEQEREARACGDRQAVVAIADARLRAGMDVDRRLSKPDLQLRECIAQDARRLGQAQRAAEVGDHGRAALEQACDVARRLIGDRPGDAELLAGLAASLHQLERTLEVLGETDAAHVTKREKLTVSRDRAAARPGDRAAERDWRNAAGSVITTEPESSIETFEEAIAAARVVVGHGDADTAQADADHLCHVLLRTGYRCLRVDSDRARAHYTECAALARAGLELWPDDPDLPGRLRIALRRLTELSGDAP